MKKVISIILVWALIFGLMVPVSAAGNDYFEAYTGQSCSLVDGLNAIGENSSFDNRAKIAAANGISDYKGSSAQNELMLDLLKRGCLKRVGGQDTVSGVEYYPCCASHYTSIVDALANIGIDSSFSNRAKIAAINGIINYSGSASQNVHLLSLLQQGKLIRSVNPSTQPEPSTENIVNINPYVCYNYQQCTADGHSIYEVTKDNAPLREKAGNEGKIITRLEAGQLLSVTQVVRNEKNNKWLRIEYINEQGETSSAYMYAGNCKGHVHNYTNALKNKNGTLKICTMCAYSIVTADGKSVEKQLVSVLDQAVKGDYSKEDADFWGLVGRVLVGEIPGVGVIADARDLFYDLTHNANIGILALDALALVPVLGLLKHADGLYALKYANDIGNAGEMVVKIGKYKLNDRVLQLFMFGKGINGKNVSGAHNMQNFMNTITSKGGNLSKCIDNTIAHPSIEGIYNITYRVGDSKALAKSPKTVYDPSVISDSQMFIWATEALSHAKKVDGTTDMIVGWASNGLKFEAKVDAAGNVLHFYPQID